MEMEETLIENIHINDEDPEPTSDSAGPVSQHPSPAPQQFPPSSAPNLPSPMDQPPPAYSLQTPYNHTTVLLPQQPYQQQQVVLITDHHDNISTARTGPGLANEGRGLTMASAQREFITRVWASLQLGLRTEPLVGVGGEDLLHVLKAFGPFSYKRGVIG